MEYTSVSDILVNREGNNRSEGVTLAMIYKISFLIFGTAYRVILF